MSKVKLDRIIFIVSLIMFYSFSAWGQPDLRQYREVKVIGHPNPASFLDSVMNYSGLKISSSCNNVVIDFDSLGRYTVIDAVTEKNDGTKFQFTNFLCFEKGYIKMESQIDILKMEEDYCFKTACFNSSCDSFWQERIDLQVISNREIIINSPIDVVVEIYKAFKPEEPYVMQFLVNGNQNNHVYNVNLEDTVPYVLIFRNSENDVVNIKQIGG